jgi:prepilin-type N-terminal cleavage/methylation domain-containing protein
MEELTMFEKMVKMRNKKGFTLMELLIVVAIIAILVAVSIPIFTSQLEKAREETDIANMRSAKAVAVAAYLTEDKTLITDSTKETVLFYDAAAGKLVTTAPTAKYGKGTSADGKCEDYMGYKHGTEATGKAIEVTIATDGTITESWK